MQYGLAQGLKTCRRGLLGGEDRERARAAGAFLATSAPDSGRALQKQAGGVDAAIGFTGSTEAMEQALRSVKRTGVVVLVGLTTRDLPVSVTELVLKGIRLVGSFLGTRDDLETVFRLGLQGIVALTEAFPLAEVPEILSRLHAGTIAGRAVITF